MKEKLFGWEGINFIVPEDWELNSLSGERNKGNFTLDDGWYIRLEGEWEYPSSAFSLEKITEKYKKEIEKRGKGVKVVEMEGKRKWFKERSGKIFSWRDRGDYYSWITYCKVCGRFFLLRVYFPEGEGRKIFFRILDTFRDHPEGEWERWGIYRLQADIPAHLTLKRYSLKTGDIVLRFEKGKEFLELHQIALGEIILKEKTLKDWVNERLKIRLKEGEEKGEVHISLTAVFKEKPWEKRKSLRAWFCALDNRIYLVVKSEVLPWPKVFCHEETGKE